MSTDSVWDYDIESELIAVHPKFKRIINELKIKKNFDRKRKKQFNNPEITKDLADRLEKFMEQGLI